MTEMLEILQKRIVGDAWVESGVSVGLTVPSAVTPGERNLILTPAHPGFADAVVIGEPRRLVPDRHRGWFDRDQREVATR
ncbi:RES domain-containing protein [Thiocapsa imhoffii]|uniref:RES domain-containing protein n=1 Tax=Thiocapsa imhoffii TaxID=382777 RepID=UPI001902F3DC|nr:RES domain-containing protein [Thiocapsa imhoffii]